MQNIDSAPLWLSMDWGGPEMDDDGWGLPQIRVDIGTKWDLEGFYAVKG